jgi:predicted  nucleic acid-binding Zn-ribbon protein|tara:strand:+ start:203 stop:577 length:375 start_codon:yes stop_codon:yes gene_type:complete
MPHQCVKCNNFYEDGAQELLKGCSCGGRLFFYIKKKALKKSQEVTEKLTKEDKEQIEKDVFDLIGEKVDKDQPVVLDFESIKIMKPGKYEIDLVHLFKNEPLIYKLEEGKYLIDIPQSFGKKKK